MSTNNIRVQSYCTIALMVAKTILDLFIFSIMSAFTLFFFFFFCFFGFSFGVLPHVLFAAYIWTAIYFVSLFLILYFFRFCLFFFVCYLFHSVEFVYSISATFFIILILSLLYVSIDASYIRQEFSIFIHILRLNCAYIIYSTYT